MSRTLTGRACIGSVCVLAALAMTGCASKQKQLENVARDWCMTIRASQVLPVYPLTEDLQPGDVFLVTVPVQKQISIYKKRGFLPLDLMVTRLQFTPATYKAHYGDAYWTGDFARTPHKRLVREIAAAPPATGGKPATVAAFDLKADLGAPRAAFPTYSFSVEKGVGARLAIPVQGVPVALGLMGSSSAYGSVQISDAFTYAAPTEALVHELKAWAGEPLVKAELAGLQASNSRTLFLRVVQRVYLTGGMVVSVTNSQSGGLAVEADLSVLGNGAGAVAPALGATGAAAPPALPALPAPAKQNEPPATPPAGGAPAPVTPPAGGAPVTPPAGGAPVTPPAGGDGAAPTTETAEPAPGADEAPAAASPPPPAPPAPVTDDQGNRRGAGYAETSAALNAAMAGGKEPGGSLQIIQASSRSVTMKENFDRPLVIGYIGFDFPILEGGELGVPIATLGQLEKFNAGTNKTRLADRLTPQEDAINEILNAYVAIDVAGNDETARQFVIAAASSIGDAAVKEAGTKAAASDRGVGYVDRLRTKLRIYLRSESTGQGVRHAEVLAALRAAKAQVGEPR